jgi:hypothetical protein
MPATRMRVAQADPYAIYIPRLAVADPLVRCQRSDISSRARKQEPDLKQGVTLRRPGASARTTQLNPKVVRRKKARADLVVILCQACSRCSGTARHERQRRWA